MTKLCSAVLKYENKLKIGWEKYRTVLKCTEMRARVEIVDVLGWNKSSAAEAELGALFLNTKEARIVRLTLAELGHPQPQTPIHIDNTTAVVIVTNTIKRQQSRAMEMI